MPPTVPLNPDASDASDADPQLEGVEPVGTVETIVLPPADPTPAETADAPVDGFPHVEEPGSVMLSGVEEWFRRMLHSFLVTYVLLFASVGIWLQRTGVARLWCVPVVSVPALHRLAFEPVSRRFALTSLRRRGWFATFVALGAGAALLTASMLVGTAYRHADRAALLADLGPVDEVVITPTSDARLRALAAIERHESQVQLEQRTGTNLLRGVVDGQLSFTAVDVDVRGPIGDAASAVAYDYEIGDAGRFGGDPSDTGIGVAGDLDRDQVDVGAELARTLAVRPGNEITVRAHGYAGTFRVRRVLPRRGLASLALDGRPNPRVLIVAPGAIAPDVATHGGPVRYVVAFSNRGPAEDGWKQATTAGAALASALASAGEGDGTDVSTAAHVTALKSDLRRRVHDRLEPLQYPIQLGAGLVAAAAVLTMLVAALGAVRSRRSDAVAMQALGGSRRDMNGALLVELWVLVLAAVAAGVGVGSLLAGSVLSRGSVRGVPSGSVPLLLDADAGTRWSALVAAFVVMMAGVHGAMGLGPRRELPGRLSVLRENTPWLQRGRLGAAVATVGVVAVVLLRGRSDIRLFVSLLLLLTVAVGTVAFLRPAMLRSVGAAAAFLVAMASLVVLARGGAASPSIAVFVAILAVAGWTLPWTMADRPRGTARWGSSRLRVWSDVALSALVGLLAAAIVLGASSAAAVVDRTDAVAAHGLGRFDTVLEPVPDEAAKVVAATDGVTELTLLRQRRATLAGTIGGPIEVVAGAFDAGTATEGLAPLSQRAPVYPTDKAVFDAVLADQTAVVLDRTAASRLPDGVEATPGSVLRVTDEVTGRSVEVTVVGLVDDLPGLPDVLLGPGLLDGLRADGMVRSVGLVRIDDAEHRDDVRAALAKTGIRPVAVETWEPASVAAPRAAARLLGLLATLAVVAGVLLVIVTVAPLLSRRGEELALWRLLGARDRAIAASVAREHIVRILGGVALGAVVGWAALAGITSVGRRSASQMLGDPTPLTPGVPVRLAILAALAVVSVGAVTAARVHRRSPRNVGE